MALAQLCEREDVDPLTANRAHVAVFVRELTSRPSLRGANVVAVVKAADRAKEMAPAWVALLLTLAYPAIALTG